LDTFGVTRAEMRPAHPIQVEKAFERAKIRNVSFTPLDQFEVELMDLEKAGVVLPPR
jgi:hypothetical protein